MSLKFAAVCGIPARRLFGWTVFLLAAGLLFAACLPEPEPPVTTVEETRIVMGTLARLQVRGAPQDAQAALQEGLDRLARVEADADGEAVRALEAAAGTGTWTEIPAALYRTLTFAQDIARRSDGAFDVTAGPLTALWDDARAAGVPPSDAAVQEARARVGYAHLELREREEDGAHRCEARLTLPGMRIDRGALIKGYALDEILPHWQEGDLGGALADLGASSILGLGHNAEGDAWQVGIRNPRGESSTDMLLVMPLTDEVLSASGDDERYFMYEGKRYHHLIDPRTGYPADTGLSSVTVILPLDPPDDPAWAGHMGLLSDMLSTAVFVLGPEQGSKLLDEFPSALAIMIGTDGKVLGEEP